MGSTVIVLLADRELCLADLAQLGATCWPTLQTASAADHRDRSAVPGRAGRRLRFSAPTTPISPRPKSRWSLPLSTASCAATPSRRIDLWLSGYGISYYYFGYVMTAMLTRLFGLASDITFNLMGSSSLR